MGSGKIRSLLILLFLIPPVGCGGMVDDLAPSGSDKRPAVTCGIPGPDVCQIAPDFTLPDTLGSSVTLSAAISSPGIKGAVLYFTMWCPVCDMHMSSMRSTALPVYPDVRFFLVDYVSGSVANARSAELSNGYANSGFSVLADTGLSVLGLYHGTMGTTIVIDKAGVVRLTRTGHG
jgi:hypothetical protein